MNHNGQSPLETKTVTKKYFMKDTDSNSKSDHRANGENSEHNSFKKIFDGHPDIVEHDLQPHDQRSFTLINPKRISILNILSRLIYVRIPKNAPCEVFIMPAGKKSYKKEYAKQH